MTKLELEELQKQVKENSSRLEKIEELLEAVIKLQSLTKPVQIQPLSIKPDSWWYKSVEQQDFGCAHMNCSTCGGTGTRHDGLGACIHMISCQCRRCSPYCL